MFLRAADEIWCAAAFLPPFIQPQMFFRINLPADPHLSDPKISTRAIHIFDGTAAASMGLQNQNPYTYVRTALDVKIWNWSHTGFDLAAALQVHMNFRSLLVSRRRNSQPYYHCTTHCC